MAPEPRVPALRFSVVVCTRNRPEDMQRCLASLLKLVEPPGQIVVVDQSTGPETAAVVRAMMGDRSGIEYLPCEQVGLSLARNLGAARAQGDVLLFTDDDCEVAPDLVSAWQPVFEADPSLGVAFGRVTAPPYDPTTGHIPTFDPGLTRSWGRELLWRGASVVGMGANMAVARGAWAAVGGFDEGLGAGAAFPAAEEIDLTLRLIRAGRRVGHAHAPSVVHHGFRNTRDASVLVQGYATATGAMYMKHVRSGDRGAAGLLLSEIGRLGLRVTRGVLTNTRPLGLNSLLGLIRGSVTSRKQPIDRERRVYRAATLEGQDVACRGVGGTVGVGPSSPSESTVR